ncbi:MAG: adenylate/guanylate cyclase domain-containing protein [Bacteroidetes bacterium]|nr:adenylate/guanylate cyclase domain-containing protein [Bacteroidota bacterium]
MNPAADIEAQLRSETIVSERLRARMLSVLFFAAVLLFLLLSSLLPEDYDAVFGSGDVRYRLIGLILAASVYEFLLQQVLSMRIRQGKSIPEPVRYVNATVEVSIPSIGILILSGMTSPLHALISPVVALYFIFIILSILRLDFTLSFFTGAVAACEYILLALWFLQDGGATVSAPLFGTTALYIARALMLAGAGAAAGVIAQLIRRKIVRSVKSIHERNAVIDLFGQQVSEPVARVLLEHPDHGAGMVRELTVMFLDIREFTPFADRHTPEQVVSYLNTLFEELIRIVSRHGGIINQFLGDGFMTTFGAPLENARHASEAVDSAREILDAIAHLVEEGRIPATRIGIGIHSGPALTGNIGSGERKQYSITGTTVILASRIEQLNKQFQSSILLSRRTMDLSGIREKDAEYLGAMHLKGTSTPVDVFRLA